MSNSRNTGLPGKNTPNKANQQRYFSMVRKNLDSF